MKIICKLGNTSKIETVNVSESDSLSVLLKKLKIKDKKAKLIYNDESYIIASILTFEEIGITFETSVTIKVNRENAIEEQRIEFNDWKDTISCSGEPKKGDNVWNIIMDGPKDSPYAKGKFKIEITFPDNYPFIQARFKFCTPICHINIDGEHICLASLDSNYKEILSITNILSQIFYMLTSPNEDNAYPQYKQKYIEDYTGYLSLAREMTQKYAK